MTDGSLRSATDRTMAENPASSIPNGPVAPHTLGGGSSFSKKDLSSQLYSINRVAHHHLPPPPYRPHITCQLPLSHVKNILALQEARSKAQTTPHAHFRDARVRSASRSVRAQRTWAHATRPPRPARPPGPPISLIVCLIPFPVPRSSPCGARGMKHVQIFAARAQ